MMHIPKEKDIAMLNGLHTTTLYRPVGPEELNLIKKSGLKKFPPRLYHQPIFYPVTNKEYAAQIAREWNLPGYGAGYVTRFMVKSEFLSKYPIQNVGGLIHDEYWIPAEDLEEFNANIVGKISVVQEFVS